VRVVKQGRLPFERRIEIAGQQPLKLVAKLDAVGEPSDEPSTEEPSQAPEPPPPRAPQPVAPPESQLRPFVALDVGALVAASLGGEIAQRCDSPCSASLPLGIGAFLAGGVALSSLDIGAEIGFLRLKAGYEKRPDPVSPVGYVGDGSAKDELTLTGISFGGTISLRTGTATPITLGLGMGVLAASVRDHRTGRYTAHDADVPPNIVDFEVSVEQTARGWYAYAGPEARIGFPIEERFELSLGVQALVLFALSPPRWDDQSVDYVQPPAGITQFAPDTLMGDVVVIAVPGVGVRAVF
jgi:hypothetical protein